MVDRHRGVAAGRGLLALPFAVLVTLLTALLCASAPIPARAEGFEPDVLAAIKYADSLLAQLEYQRAREVLETTAADGRVREVRRGVRAKLYAALGRVRAELGDEAGMAEAFSDAVVLDPTVTLPRSASPKILAALERAREAAPATAPSGPRGRKGDDEGRKPKATTPPAPPLPAPPLPAPPLPAPIAPPPAASPAPARPSASPAPSPSASPAPSPSASPAPSPPPSPTPKPATSPAPKPGAEAFPLPPPAAPRSPALVHRIVGALSERARVRIVVEAIAVPRTARIEARMRPAGKRVYEPFLMPWVEPIAGAARTRTATLAAIELTLDEPWYEVYFEARQGKKVVARAGSADAPFLIEPARVPSMSDAWAADQAAPSGVATGVVPAGPGASPAAKTGASPEVAAVRTTTTSTGALAGGAPAGGGLTTTETWVLVGGVAAVALIVVVVVLSLTGGGNDSDCLAEEGRGCTDVRILPLMRF